MKPLHHYLRRFCSEQVQILLERMDNHYGDEFAGGDTKWEVYTDHRGLAYDYYTKIEAYCVTKTCQEQRAIYKRQQMLTGILERTMSRAVSKWDYEREQRAARGGDEEAQFPNQLGAYQQIAQQQAQHLLNNKHQAQHNLQNQIRNWLNTNELHHP